MWTLPCPPWNGCQRIYSYVLRWPHKIWILIVWPLPFPWDMLPGYKRQCVLRGSFRRDMKDMFLTATSLSPFGPWRENAASSSLAWEIVVQGRAPRDPAVQLWMTCSSSPASGPPCEGGNRSISWPIIRAQCPVDVQVSWIFQPALWTGGRALGPQGGPATHSFNPLLSDTLRGQASLLYPAGIPEA